MYFRSPVIGFFSGLMACLPTAVYVIVIKEADVPVMLAIVPLSIALLVATRLATRDWLEMCIPGRTVAQGPARGSADRADIDSRLCISRLGNTCGRAAV